MPRVPALNWYTSSGLCGDALAYAGMAVLESGSPVINRSRRTRRHRNEREVGINLPLARCGVTTLVRADANQILLDLPSVPLPYCSLRSAPP